MSLTSRVPTAEQHRHLAESWLDELNFYESEVGSCELSLEQFVPSMQDNGMLVKAEQFQNQYIHQRDVINELKYKIRQYIRALPPSREDRVGENHARHFGHLSEEVNAFRKVFNELLLGFDEFLRQCD